MTAESSATRDHQTDVLLISGFLGAGKTTLLKRILSWESDLSNTVVLVNEFGDVGIDGSLLEGSGSDVVELTSGCICCTLSADLKQSLLRILEEFKPLRILIESSGVADPTAVAQVVQHPDLSGNMTLGKIVTVLDADFWEAREVFGPLFYHQLEMAHLLLLNKVDRVEKKTIAVFLDEIHQLLPNTQVVPTIHCAIDPETLWMRTEPSAEGLRPMALLGPMPFGQHPLPRGDAATLPSAGNEPLSGSPAVDASGFVTFSFQAPGVMDEIRFRNFVHNLPMQVFRMKGYVRLRDRTAFVNFVGGKPQWSEWQGKPGTRLAFIGWDVQAEETLENLRDCLIG